MRGIRAAIVTVAGGIAVSCGVRIETPLPVTPPIQEASIRTYGWSRAMGLGQEIRVTLTSGARLGDVVDLTFFAPFRPDMTHEEAVAVAGRPTSMSTDEYGQSWYYYQRPAATIRLGCRCSSSGDSVSANCQWETSAVRNVLAEQGLAPQLVNYVAAARAVPEQVDYRTLQIATYGFRESVSWDVESKRSEARIYWRAGNRVGGACKRAV